LSDIAKVGRIRVAVDGRTYKAEWRVVGPSLEIVSEIGTANVVLGALKSAPGSVAQEKFRDMVRQANRPAKVVGDRAWFNVRDA
jgi:hypothetical protein